MSMERFTLNPVFPVWLILLLLASGIAAAFLQYVKFRSRLGESRGRILFLLRMAALLMILTVALDPSWMSQTEHRIAPSIAVFMDTSKYMGQAASDGKGTRLDQAKTLLSEGRLLESLGKKFDVTLYGLSGRADPLRPLSPGDLERIEAGGDSGDLSEALGRLGDRKNSLAVLISDGNIHWNENPKALLPTLTVPVGNREVYRDILIKEIKAPSLAFKGREASIDVTVRSHGFLDTPIQLLLKDGENLVTLREIRIQADSGESDSGETRATLSFTPSDVGRKSLSISVPHQIGERIVENNRVHLSMEVTRDKTRILMVSGTPSMNYRFMRAALKKDPSIDLLSFVILRTPSDVLQVRSHEQSLIPFPVDTLFLKELANFDLVVFDNFNYSLYLSPEHLEGVRNFVDSGGGFAVIGGPDLFNEGTPGLSPIAELLPFRFVEDEFYRRETPLGVKLTRKGIRHPLMQFSEAGGGVERLRFWQEMPPVDGINLTEAKKPSTILLESAGGIPWPVLTVSEYGKGRVLALTTDYAWKWYMGKVARNEGTQGYLRLVHRMVRWLTKDPGMHPVQVILPESTGAIGKQIDLRVRVHGEDSSDSFDLKSRTASGKASFSILDPEGVEVEWTLGAASIPGEHTVSFIPKKEGIYRIRIQTSTGDLEESIPVSGPFDRLDAAPRHDRLEAISRATGGKLVTESGDLLKTIEEYARRGERRFIEEKRLPVWANAYAMALIIGLLSAEWFFRRRWGLV
ncbi:MAG: hypothetical protein C4530_23820 [Desulfobacteraceae bacterium]|nr:MAG: hypothetical protein C4530_23820 [Desulfobacteraceae bacterium]